MRSTLRLPQWRPAGWRLAEVPVRALRRDASPGCTHQVPLLEQVGLVDVLDGLGILAEGRGQGLEADRPARELLDDGAEELAVDVVQAGLVHIQGSEGLPRHGRGHAPVMEDLRVVSNPL